MFKMHKNTIIDGMNFILSIPVMVWLIISGIFFAAGEFLSKKFAVAQSWNIFFLIILADFLSITFWLPAILERNQLSIVGTMWSVLSLLLTVVIGLMIFGEKLNTVGVVGILFAIVSIILLSIA